MLKKKFISSAVRKGFLVGFIAGVITVSSMLTCGVILRNDEGREGLICNYENMETILSAPFLASMIIAIPAHVILKFDIVESGMMEIIIWIFGVGLYAFIGGLIGWCFAQIKKFTQAPKNFLKTN